MSDEEPLLSGEETDALLDAMRASEAQQEVSVDALDLTTPDRGLREALGYADLAADRYANPGSKVFLRHLGVATSFDAEPTEISPFDVFRSSVATGAAMAVLRGASGSQALLMVGPALVNAVLDRQLGAPINTGTSGDEGPAPEAALSPVDRRLLRPFLEGVVGAFSKAWCRPGASVSFERIVATPDDYPPIEHAEPVLRMGWRIAPGSSASERMSLAVPSAFLFETGPEGEAPPAKPNPSDRRKVVRRLIGAAVELSAILGTARSSVRDVLRLGDGDVIRLGTIAGGPVEVAVGGRTVATGQPVIHHGNVAIEITSVFKQPNVQGEA